MKTTKKRRREISLRAFNAWNAKKLVKNKFTRKKNLYIECFSTGGEIRTKELKERLEDILFKINGVRKIKNRRFKRGIK